MILNESLHVFTQSRHNCTMIGNDEIINANYDLDDQQTFTG